jgi:GT2 family glycosyltransferase
MALISAMPSPGIVFLSPGGSQDVLLMQHAHAHGVQVVMDMKHARLADLTQSWLETASHSELRVAASGAVAHRLAAHGIPVIDMELATDETRFFPLEFREEGKRSGSYGEQPDPSRLAVVAAPGVSEEAIRVVSQQCPLATVVRLDLAWRGAGSRTGHSSAGLEAMSPFQAARLTNSTVMLVDGGSPHAAAYVGMATFQGKPVIVVRASKELQELRSVHLANNWIEAGALACMDIGVRNRRRLWEELVRYSASGSVDKLLGPIPTKYSISIIVALHNNAALVERVVRSLALHTIGISSGVEVIVIDGASTDDSAAALKLAEAAGVRVVMSQEGSAPAVRNAGLRAMTKPDNTGTHLVAFLDSDMIVTSSSWLQEAAAILRADPEVGAVGWAAGWFNPESRKELPPCYYASVRGMNQEALHSGYRKSVAYLGSGGMVVRYAALLSTNGFDERFAPAGYEDTDLSFAIRDAGYALAYRFTTGIMHEAHASTSRFQSEGVHYDEVLGRNGVYFRKKWGNHPDLFSSDTDNAAGPKKCRQCPFVRKPDQ